MRIATSLLGLVLLLAGCKRGPEKIEHPPEASKPVSCGSNVCQAGQVCCNPSCGICAAPDAMCTQQFCDVPRDGAGSEEPLPDAPSRCDQVRCAGDTHCEMVAVQCIRAPCPPVPECKPDHSEAEAP